MPIAISTASNNLFILLRPDMSRRSILALNELLKTQARRSTWRSGLPSLRSQQEPVPCRLVVGVHDVNQRPWLLLRFAVVRDHDVASLRWLLGAQLAPLTYHHVHSSRNHASKGTS